MKHSDNQDCYDGGSAAMYGMLNDFIGSFWQNVNLKMPLDLKQKYYYDVNIALSKAFKKHVELANIRCVETRENVKYIGEDKIKEMLAHKMSYKLAEFLMANERINITNSKVNFNGDMEYTVTLPIIVFPPTTTTKAGDE